MKTIGSDELSHGAVVLVQVDVVVGFAWKKTVEIFCFSKQSLFQTLVPNDSLYGHPVKGMDHCVVMCCLCPPGFCVVADFSGDVAPSQGLGRAPGLDGGGALGCGKQAKWLKTIGQVGKVSRLHDYFFPLT